MTQAVSWCIGAADSARRYASLPRTGSASYPARPSSSNSRQHTLNFLTIFSGQGTTPQSVKKYSCGQAGGGYDFEPVIVETYGRLGEPAFELLARLARVAAESGKVDEGKFIENTLKEMSVALCRGNGSILAAGQKVLTQVTGHDVQPGLPRPCAELI